MAGRDFNFKNFGFEPPGDGGGRQSGNFPIARQSSIYSLTFDEFQSTVGSVGKDFGSMNMDELLKSIWSAEENQTNGSSSAAAGVNGQEALQRQGSLTLPRTISQKTVDEVWKNMSKESACGGVVGFGVPQREPTLGEITLEEFLSRAGAVREEAQLGVKANNNVAFFGRNNGLGFGFQQQPAENNVAANNQIGIQNANLPLNVNGARSAGQQMGSQQQPIRQQPPQQQQILPKQPILQYGGGPMGMANGQLGSPRMRGGMAGLSDPGMNNPMVQNVALQGMVGLGTNGVSGSPAVSSDGLNNKSNGDTPSVSPVPYTFNGGLRGRKTAALEKVVERRQRRMIKNRESAARSRARKQVNLSTNTRFTYDF